MSAANSTRSPLTLGIGLALGRPRFKRQSRREDRNRSAAVVVEVLLAAAGWFGPSARETAG